MSDAEIQKAIDDAKAQRKHIHALIKDSSATLKSLADTERQLHNEIDRKTKALGAAKSAEHRTALKKLVGLLTDDAKRLHKGIQGRKELQDKRRHAIKRIGDRIRRLRKRRHHAGQPVSGIGPDVSVYQASVSWDAVASKCAFGIAKVSEGLTYDDPTWSSARRQAMEKADLATGLYHFGHPSNSAIGEAQHFVATVKSAGAKIIGYEDWSAGKDGFCLFLDFETAPYSQSWAEAFADEVERLTGHKPGLYGGGYSLNPVVGALSHFAKVWIAAYASAWQPYFSGPDSVVGLWQFTDHESVPGVSSPCDCSRTV